MKKIMFIAFISVLIMLFPVKAVTLDIEVDPAEVWIGDDVRISCFYDQNPQDKTPYAFIERMSWNKELTKFNDTFFECTYTPPLLGTYQVECSDGANNSSQEFKVIDLDVQITDSPDKVYLDHEMVLHVKLVERGDSDRVVTGDISSSDFEVYIGSKKVSIDTDKTYPYGEEWIITTQKITSGFNLGSYSLDVRVSYKSKTFTDSEQVEVKGPLEFELIDIDKTWINKGDNITLTLKTSYEGEFLELKKEYLKIWLDSDQLTISDIYQGGSYSYIEVPLPNLDPGTYTLKLRFSYMDFVVDINKDIDYVIPVSGTMEDSKGKAINVKFTFENKYLQKTISTDGKGDYSDYIPPGEYKLEVEFPNSKLILYEIDIDEFDNPVRFNYLTEDVGLPGVGIGGVFVYEIDLAYSDVYLEMEYDDSKLLDESEILVYKCENWNFGRELCNSDWRKLNTDIDTIKNTVEINTTSLSAFLIGYKKNLNLDFGTDKDDYHVGEVIRVTGIIEDEDKKPVPDVKITANIPGTRISSSTNSDDNGVFSLDFQGPDKDGEYDIIVKAEKTPFISVESSESIEVSKRCEITIILAESLKINKGELVSVPVEIVNTGQIDLSNIKLQLTGVPEEYYILSKPEIFSLKPGDNEKLFIDFNVPLNASGTSYSGDFEVKYNGNSTEKHFILSFLSGEEREENIKESEGFKFPSLIPTGEFVLEGMTGDIVLIIIVGVVSFSVAVFLKMRKYSTGFQRKIINTANTVKIQEKHGREDVKNLLLGIKMEIERPRTKKTVKTKKKTKKRSKKKTSKKKKK